MISLGDTEGQRLEFKAADVLDSPAYVAREAAAMLNAIGGEIWIGVEEREGKASRLEPVRDAERARSALLDAQWARLGPAASMSVLYFTAQNGLPGVPTCKVTQALGGAASFHTVDPHVREFDHSADRLLVCTDGLTNYVARPVIADSLRAGNVAQAAESLLSLALDAGGLDNITLVVVDVDGPRSSRGSR